MTLAIPRQFDLANDDQRNLTEIWSGLAREPKRLPCKLFYDAEGSRLFESITRLPEYYPTRTELEILERHRHEMAHCIGPLAALVEFGSGASVKTRLLLDALDSPRVYVPIDISTDMLLSSARALEARYPELDVRPLVADYMLDLDLPLTAAERQGPVVAFFPGSTIGNFEHEEAVSFLRRVRRACGSRSEILIGVDLLKARATLEAAYDDSQGVTARFNLNALRVLNRQYGAQFRLDDFSHRALWNEPESRVEMHLVSRRALVVRVGGRSFSFRAGEAIVTEHCYKYTLEDFRKLCASAELEVSEVWLDARGTFSLQRLTPA